MEIGKLFRSMAVTLILITSLVNFTPADARQAQGPAQIQAQVEPPSSAPSEWVDSELEIGPSAPPDPCSDTGVTGNGNALDECQGTSFTLAGITWDLSVYYTLDTGAGNDWILTHTQVTPILGWMQTAYEAYYEQTGRTYGLSTCGRHIRAKVMKGDGWAGIAWWPNSCYIGLDAPMIRGNGGQATTMHEIRHKVVQFAYPNCLSDWQPDYPGNTTYIVEGDADYGPSTVDDYGYMNTGYDQSKSL
ncbi:MAG: hypothetical protein MUQ30_17385, partial [Anaerolineae bacterium]|nr:hypothetical protein [Anaerolineae bacterium]